MSTIRMARTYGGSLVMGGSSITSTRPHRRTRTAPEQQGRVDLRVMAYELSDREHSTGC